MKSDQKIPEQVDDDEELLQLMMEDYRNSDAIYKTTNYWYKKTKRLYGFLLQNGLRDFRRNNDPKGTAGAVLRAFGATDNLNAALNYEEAYDRAASFRQSDNTAFLGSLSVSDVGNPEDLHDRGGSAYTNSWLNFYIRYCYVSRFMNLDNKVIVELGSGSAKQAELIKKAHPTATILLFDIIPQLYIQNQYLKKVFGKDFVDYEVCREMKSLDGIEAGKIYVFANSQLPMISIGKVDLFWNAASFQEMEPNVVKHYLDIVSKATKNIYLMQHMKGQSVSTVPGTGGVLEAVTLETYKECLPDYTVVDLSRAELANADASSKTMYSDSFWTRD